MSWWRYVVASEIRKILAFRVDFWVTFLGQTFIQLFIARALWQNIFETSGQKEMEGFTLPMMTLYYIIVPIANKMLTGENIGFISREIYDGSFNRYLLYPLSFFQYKTLTYLTYSAFYGLQLFLLFFAFHYIQSGHVTLSQVGALFSGLFLLMIAASTYAMLAMVIELLSLWADNVWSLMVMARFVTHFFGGSFVPVAFFPEWLQRVLTFTPFPYLISLPVRATMGLVSPEEYAMGLFHLVFWTIILRSLAGFIWSKGQHRYTGVGI